LRVSGGARRWPQHGADPRRSRSPDRQQARVRWRRAAAGRHRDALVAAHPDGLRMAPTLADHDRMIVNNLVYEIGEPPPGDIVMLYYPLNPEKMFVKRVIAREGDSVRIVDGRVYVNDVPLHD